MIRSTWSENYYRMNHSTRVKRSNAIGRRTQILVKFLLGITVFGLSSSTAVCQRPELEDVASRFTKRLKQDHLHSVIVADFDGPGDSDTQLGRALAGAL